MPGERLLLRGLLWLAVVVLSALTLWAYSAYSLVELGAASHDVLMLRENPDWPVLTRPGWVDTVRAMSVVGLSVTVIALAVVNHLAREDERRGNS